MATYIQMLMVIDPALKSREVPAMISNKALVTLALLVPIGIALVATQVQFWLGAVIANPVGILAAVAGGVWIASKIQFSQKWYAVAFWSFYLLFLFVGTPFIGLLTSCVNGDCI